MTNIIIPNYGNGLNRGAAALLSSRIKAIKRYIPDSRFSVFSFSPELYMGIDEDFIKRNNVTIYKVAFSTNGYKDAIFSVLRLIIWGIAYRFKIDFLVKDERFKEYSNADIIISTGGDVLTEDYGSLSYLVTLFNVFVGLLFGAKIVIYAESIGPFKNRWNKMISKILFNKAMLITVRENISHKNLCNINVGKPPIFVTTDSAFLLDPAPEERVTSLMYENGININANPLIGFSLSKIISDYGFPNIQNKNEKYQKYIQITANVIDTLITQFNSTVILIPHVTEPINDDRKVNADVYKLIKNKTSCKLLETECTAEETKGIIGRCELFIGSRMHSTIASTSMLVPTIAIAYSHKTHGIIGELLKQEEYVIDIKEFHYEKIITTIYKLWDKKENVKEQLQKEIPLIKENSLLTAKLVHDQYINICKEIQN